MTDLIVILIIIPLILLLLVLLVRRSPTKFCAPWRNGLPG